MMHKNNKFTQNETASWNLHLLCCCCSLKCLTDQSIHSQAAKHSKCSNKQNIWIKDGQNANAA